MSKSKSPTPSSITAYLSRLPADRKAALEKLRRLIWKLQPKVKEGISYSIPAFFLEGAVIAGFNSTSKGCSYYPFSGSTFSTLAKDLENWDHTKSALHFTPEHPIPPALVKKLLQARVAEVRARIR